MIYSYAIDDADANVVVLWVVLNCVLRLVAAVSRPRCASPGRRPAVLLSLSCDAVLFPCDRPLCGHVPGDGPLVAVYEIPLLVALMDFYALATRPLFFLLVVLVWTKNPDGRCVQQPITLVVVS